MRELWKNLKFAWKYAKDQKWMLIAFAFCNLLTIIINVIVPIISAYIIVKLTANQLKQVVLMALVLFGVEIVRNIIDFLCRYFAQVSYRETFTKLQLDLGSSILRLRNSCIDAHSSGVFIQRLTNDTSKIADVFNLLNSQIYVKLIKKMKRTKYSEKKMNRYLVLLVNWFEEYVISRC